MKYKRADIQSIDADYLRSVSDSIGEVGRILRDLEEAANDGQYVLRVELDRLKETDIDDFIRSIEDKGIKVASRYWSSNRSNEYPNAVLLSWVKED